MELRSVSESAYSAFTRKIDQVPAPLPSVVYSASCLRSVTSANATLFKSQPVQVKRWMSRGVHAYKYDISH